MEIELAPGQEEEFCQPFILDRDAAVNWSEGLRSDGTHHGVVHRTSVTGSLPALTSGDAWDPTRPVPCDLVNVDDRGAMSDSSAVGSPPGTPGLTSRGTLPEDVAFRLARGDLLVLSLHMINPTDHEVRACYRTNLHTIPEAQVKYDAGMLRWPSWFITLPANGKASAAMACPVVQDIQLVSLVSHMHERGVGYTAALLDGDPLTAPAEVRRLYESTEWHEPVPTVFPGGLGLKQGQWIRWQCDYENPEARNVAQGFRTTDEMCQLNALYWPESADMNTCGASLGFPTELGRPMTRGTAGGADFQACFAGKRPQDFFGGGPDTSASRFAAQSCVTGLCPEVAGHVWDMLSGAVDPATLTCR